MSDATVWMRTWLSYLGDEIEQVNGADIARNERGWFTAWLVNETKLLHDLFLVYFFTFIYNLYMFRSSPGPSSGRKTVFMRNLLLAFLYSWLSGVQNGMKRRGQQNIKKLSDLLGRLLQLRVCAKVKVKVSLSTPWKYVGWSRGIAPHILNPGSRRRRENCCHERWVALWFGRKVWPFAAKCYSLLQGRRPIISQKCSVLFIYLFTHVFHYFCGSGQLRWRCESLRAGRSGDRIPMEARLSAPVQTGPGTHPASCTIGTGFFRWVKRPERGVDHPYHLAPRLNKE
jgi:hypothetical protein